MFSKTRNDLPINKGPNFERLRLMVTFERLRSRGYVQWLRSMVTFERLRSMVTFSGYVREVTFNIEQLEKLSTVLVLFEQL